MIAEEVVKVMPEIVNLDSDGKPYSIKPEMEYLMLKEIQNLNARIKKLESQCAGK